MGIETKRRLWVLVAHVRRYGIATIKVLRPECTQLRRPETLNLEGASTALVYALDEAANEGRFEPMLKGIKDVILGANINVGRLAIPLHGAAGFRHPTLYAVQLMWTAPDDAYDTTIITHEHHRAYLAELAHAEKHGADAAKTMIASPYHRAPVTTACTASI